MPKEKTQQHLEIVAGPNGSGKTTFARAYFNLKNGRTRFINADTIASGLAPGQENHAAFHAGRVMLEAIDDALKRQESFAFETTLAGKTWLSLLRRAIESKYEISIYFVYLEKPSLNVERVKQRVREGGHSIPRETILRRYTRSFDNFWNIYRPLCSNWFIFDNSNKKPICIQSKPQFEKLSEQEKMNFQRAFLT